MLLSSERIISNNCIEQVKVQELFICIVDILYCSNVLLLCIVDIYRVYVVFISIVDIDNKIIYPVVQFP